MCWERAAELNVPPWGRWRAEPRLVGWRARPFPAAPGEHFVWALTLGKLSQRVQGLAPAPGDASQLAARSPAQQLSGILAHCWDQAPAASLREAIALLAGPVHEQALALCDQVYPGLFHRTLHGLYAAGAAPGPGVAPHRASERRVLGRGTGGLWHNPSRRLAPW